MEQEQPMTLTYEKCLELGFKRHNGHDPVFLRQNGYEYFIVELQVGNRAFEWNIHTHQVNYFIDGNIVKRGITASEFEELRKESKKIEVFEDSLEWKSPIKKVYCVRFHPAILPPLTWQFDDEKDAEKFKELLLKAK